MSIERVGEWEFSLTCDICGYEEDPCNTFDEAVELKRDMGWKSQRDNGDWCDVCPRCLKPKSTKDMKEEYKKRRKKHGGK